MTDSHPTIEYSEAFSRSVLNSLSAHIAILDGDGIILETNRAWRNFAIANGMPQDYTAIGENYLQVCDAAQDEAGQYARQVAAGIRDVVDGRVDEFLLDYPCHGPDGPRWYYMRAIRMAIETPLRVVVSHEDITQLKLTEEKLRRSEGALLEQKQGLEEANIALKVLLKQRESDKTDLEQKVLGNVKDLVLPYLEKLKRVPLKAREKTLVGIIDTHLQDIISPLMQRLSNANILLTPQEMQIATLVKDGKASKEIAAILNVSEATVHFHRKNLRKKFGLNNTRTNLRSYLLSMNA
ncbi:MAG: LuxR C-terminal-related transcriptional regulator [Desulfosarcinaceae bacterium]|nr:LuxR C-terminal-related transcriptional regulator [Desulfosarcinaceae bacterium]